MARLHECNIGKPKVLHRTIEHAWLSCFWLFAVKGIVAVPYRCAAAKAEHARVVLWDTPSGGLRVEVCKRISGNMFTPCPGWHITRNTRHILTGARHEVQALRAAAHPMA